MNGCTWRHGPTLGGTDGGTGRDRQTHLEEWTDTWRILSAQLEEWTDALTAKTHTGELFFLVTNIDPACSRVI